MYLPIHDYIVDLIVLFSFLFFNLEIGIRVYIFLSSYGV